MYMGPRATPAYFEEKIRFMTEEIVFLRTRELSPLEIGVVKSEWHQPTKQSDKRRRCT